MRHLLALLLVMALAAPIIVPAPIQASPIMARNLAVGDSITMGQTWDPAPGAFNPPQIDWTGYRLRLSELLTAAGYQVEFVGSQANGCAVFAACHHEGHGGWSISHIDAEIAVWIEAQHPTVITLQVGTPDAASLIPDMPGSLTKLLAHIYAVDPSIAVVVSTIPPIADSIVGPAPNIAVTAYNAAMPGVVAARRAAGQNVVMVNGGGSLTLADLTDGLHPLPWAYAQIADAFYGGLVSVLPAPDLCDLSQRIALTVTPQSGDRLAVTIVANGRGNTIRSVVFGPHPNADVSAVPIDGASASFTAQRRTPGPMQVPFTVTDICGRWPLFVGGGARDFLRGIP